MRVFLICQQSSQRYDVPAYQFWEPYFKNGLVEAGHSWVQADDADWARGLALRAPDELARWRAETWDRTLTAIKTAHAHKPIDLVLSYLFPQQVEPAAVSAIRALGIPCVNFFCDNIREFTRIPESYRPFDLHWVPEAEARALYQRASMPFVYAPMPVWIAPAQRQLPQTELNQTTFIGSHDILREDLLARAVACGLDLRVHGPGWPGSPDSTRSSSAASAQTSRLQKIKNQFTFVRDHGLHGLAMKLTYARHRPPARDWLARSLGPPIFSDDYLRITRESAVTVGINRYPSFRHPFSRPHTYSRLRDLEAPMLGACYLAEMAPGLTDLFEPDVEIETYRTAEELAAKAAALRADPARRRSLRERAQNRALSEHTIGNTLAKISAALGLK